MPRIRCAICGRRKHAVTREAPVHLPETLRALEIQSSLGEHAHPTCVLAERRRAMKRYRMRGLPPGSWWARGGAS